MCPTGYRDITRNKSVTAFTLARGWLWVGQMNGLMERDETDCKQLIVVSYMYINLRSEAMGVGGRDELTVLSFGTARRVEKSDGRFLRVKK